MAHPRRNDDEDIIDFLGKATIIGYIETQCEEYLNGQVFRQQICLDSGEYSDELELYAPVGSNTIQKIIDDHEELDTISLRRPAPVLLPIIISKIANDPDSFIIPSDKLNIQAILPRAPKYQLEAIICEINQRNVIFMKNLTTDEWYYYQKGHSCEQFSSSLSEYLNDIIESGSVKEQNRLIKSSHFLISMIFYNAVKYIYKQKER